MKIFGLSDSELKVIRDAWAVETAVVGHEGAREGAAVVVDRLAPRLRKRRSTYPTVPRTVTTESGIRLVFDNGLEVALPETDPIRVALAPIDESPDPPFFEAIQAAVILALGRLGVASLHAVVFSLDGHSIIAVGESRSGKSSMAAAVVASGGRIVSDDSVLCRTLHGSAEVAPFRRFLAFRSGTLDLLPSEIRSGLVQFDRMHEAVWRLDLDDIPDLRLDSITPSQVWSVSLDRRLAASRVRAIGQGECLAALISATSIAQISPRYPQDRKKLLPMLTDLSETTTKHQVRLGRDLMTTPEATLRRLISDTTP